MIHRSRSLRPVSFRLFFSISGPTFTAFASAFPLYLIRASDGVWRGRLQEDEHALLLLFLLATLLLALKRSSWSWLPWGASAFLLIANGLEIGGRLPAEGDLNLPVWFLLASGMLISLISLPGTADIFREAKQDDTR